MRASPRSMRTTLATLTLAALAACGTAEQSKPVAPGEITVTITSPAPGEELLAADDPTIVVSGTITTTNPGDPLEAWVNGVKVDLVAGAFFTRLTPEPGVNHIKVEGGNGTDALVGEEFDVLWAPEYLTPLPGGTGFDLAGALELRIGQRFFDARVPGSVLDMTTDPVVARDVSSALELILRHLDLAALLEGGIEIGEGDAALAITIPSVTPGNIVVDARIVEGAQAGIDLKIDLVGVFLAMDGAFSFAGRELEVDGGITADLRASARLTLGRGEDGAIAVGVSGVTATVGPLAPGFRGDDGEELDALITIGGSDFRALIEGLLVDLIPTFTDRLPPFLETLLGETDRLLDNVEFTLAPLGTPITLQLDGQIGTLDVRAGTPSGHVTVRQDLTVRTTGTPVHAQSRGAPRVAKDPAAPALNNSGVHLTLRQDLLNAVLHAVWNAGLLEGPLSYGGLSAVVSAKLPPLVRPTPAASSCQIDGERCDVLLQLGQVEVALPSFQQTFGLNATAGARIDVDGGTVSLKIQMTPDLVVWQTSAEDGSLTPDGVRELIALVVWPQLFGALGENLKIELPLPDLAELGLADLAPGLENAQLQLQMRQRPNVTGERLVLGADLLLSTPLP